MSMRKILVDDTNRELCPHGTESFPMTVSHDDLWDFEGKSVDVYKRQGHRTGQSQSFCHIRFLSFLLSRSVKQHKKSEIGPFLIDLVRFRIMIKT